MIKVKHPSLDIYYIYTFIYISFMKMNKKSVCSIVIFICDIFYLYMSFGKISCLKLFPSHCIGHI